MAAVRDVDVETLYAQFHGDFSRAICQAALKLSSGRISVANNLLDDPFVKFLNDELRTSYKENKRLQADVTQGKTQIDSLKADNAEMHAKFDALDLELRKYKERCRSMEIVLTNKLSGVDISTLSEEERKKYEEQQHSDAEQIRIMEMIRLDALKRNAQTDAVKPNDLLWSKVASGQVNVNIQMSTVTQEDDKKSRRRKGLVNIHNDEDEEKEVLKKTEKIVNSMKSPEQIREERRQREMEIEEARRQAEEEKKEIENERQRAALEAEQIELERIQLELELQKLEEDRLRAEEEERMKQESLEEIRALEEQMRNIEAKKLEMKLKNAKRQQEEDERRKKEAMMEMMEKERKLEEEMIRLEEEILLAETQKRTEEELRRELERKKELEDEERKIAELQAQIKTEQEEVERERAAARGPSMLSNMVGYFRDSPTATQSSSISARPSNPVNVGPKIQPPNMSAPVVHYPGAIQLPGAGAGAGAGAYRPQGVAPKPVHLQSKPVSQRPLRSAPKPVAMDSLATQPSLNQSYAMDSFAAQPSINQSYAMDSFATQPSLNQSYAIPSTLSPAANTTTNFGSSRPMGSAPQPAAAPSTNYYNSFDDSFAKNTSTNMSSKDYTTNFDNRNMTISFNTPSYGDPINANTTMSFDDFDFLSSSQPAKQQLSHPTLGRAQRSSRRLPTNVAIVSPNENETDEMRRVITGEDRRARPPVPGAVGFNFDVSAVQLKQTGLKPGSKL